MTLNQFTDNTISSKRGQPRQVFTFFVNDMMFGMDVKNVLILSQDYKQIQRLPVEERGFCGVVKYQTTLVPVLDFAHRLGLTSGNETRQHLIDDLNKQKQGHIHWFNALEDSLKKKKPFEWDIDTEECDFTKWLNSYVTRDETLRDLLTSFSQPHKQLHQLSGQVLALREAGDVEQAIAMVQHERDNTLGRMNRSFERVQQQIQTEMRRVLIFVTLNGKTPLYAMLIDEINDVINYNQSDFQSSKDGALGLIKKIEHVLVGIYAKKDQHDCLYFDINKLTDIDELMAKVS